MTTLGRAVADELLARLRNLPVASSVAGLTVGIEHEILLVDQRGDPATHEQSQAVLRGFADGEHATDEDTHAGETFATKARATCVDAVAVLKYDHHPHLLELEMPPAATLFQMSGRLECAMGLVGRVVRDAGLAVSASPVWHGSALDSRLVSFLPRFVGLRSYRTKLLRRRGDPPSDSVNYGATIAATQTHIGGLGWWRRPAVLRRIMAMEPAVFGFAYCAYSFPPRLRWERYESVFRGFPLCGFPELKRWDVVELGEALADSPLAGAADKTGSGATLRELGHLPDDSWDTFFEAVRDFPVVRPRLYGTVEARGDPAQPTAPWIMGLAALRLAQAVHATSSVDEPSLFAARRAWWEQARSDAAPRIEAETLARARAALATRGIGEERFLDVFATPQGKGYASA